MFNRLYVLLNLNNEWVPCGLLEYEEAGRTSSSIFRYGKKYLEREDAISIDPIQLPLEDRTIETPEGFVLFNGIRDAGPDKWGRYLLDKKFGRTLSELEYIAASSDDRVGALSFTDSIELGPRQYQPGNIFEKKNHITRLDLAQLSGALDDATKGEDSERLRKYLSYGPSLGGARPKASVLLNKELYLAKFSLSVDIKNEPLIEYATMTLAKRCGLNVPELALKEVDKRTVYLIKRFDRNNGKRIPFISGLTMTGTHESDFGAWSYFALADAIVRFSGDQEQDLRELFRRLIFNIAVFNNDDHLRNFGFVCTEGRWRLSPLYDVLPAVVNSETYTLAMTLGRDGKKASFPNALSMVPRFRIDEREGKRIIAEVVEVTNHWERHFKDVGVSDFEVKMLRNSFVNKQ